MRSILVAGVVLTFLSLSSARAQEPVPDSACGPSSEKFKTDTDKKSHPEPQAVSDKAVLVVVRPTMLGNKVQTKFAVDGKWVGINRGDNYFIVNLDPGLRQFCSQAENKAKSSLTVEAGKIYFIQQHVRMGFMKAENSLEVLDESKGREALAKCHPSTFTAK